MRLFMIDKRLTELALNSPDIFISNYLLNDAFSNLPKWKMLGESIYEEFPFLSLKFILESEEDFSTKDFVLQYNGIIKDEESKLFNLIRSLSSFPAEDIDTLSELEKNAEGNIRRLQFNLNKLELNTKSQIDLLYKTIEQLEKECKELKNKESLLEQNYNDNEILHERKERKPVVPNPVRDTEILNVLNSLQNPIREVVSALCNVKYNLIEIINAI